MSLLAKDSGGSYTPMEPGSYPARCVGLIDLGVMRTIWQGQERHAEKVRIVWELPTERTEDGKPRWMSKMYTKSLNEKAALRHDLDGWRGVPFQEQDLRGFDLKNVIGTPCLLSIVNTQREGKTYTNIASVSKVIKGMDVPPLENPPFIFDMDAPDCESVMANLPQWMQDEIAKSLTWQARAGSTNMGEAEDDGDLPF